MHNLGCKVNAYGTEAMQQLLEENGYEIVPFEEKGRCIYRQYVFGDEHGLTESPADAAPGESAIPRR